MKAFAPTPRARFFAAISIGLGFMLLGVMTFIGLESKAASSYDFSTVPAKVDYPAPSLILSDLSGNPVSIDAFKGQVVLVNLWATWCPPCREEMPTLLDFYEKYKGDGFMMVAIDQGESMELVIPFAEEFQLTFPVWLDEDQQASREFGTMSLPSSYVIDRNGQVKLMWLGGISKRNLEKYVPSVILE